MACALCHFGVTDSGLKSSSGSRLFRKKRIRFKVCRNRIGKTGSSG
ncbi:MAG: hypothetical protein P8X74_03170 [Reinekea sp.]